MGKKEITAIGNRIEKELAACFDQDRKKKLFRERFDSIYQVVLGSCPDGNDGLLEGLCHEIVMIEQALLKSKVSENLYKSDNSTERLLIHYSDIAYEIAKNKFFGTRDSFMGQYLRPLYTRFLESVAENLKTKAAHTISETLNELNYACGLSRRVSIRLGIAGSGYRICI